MGILRNQKTSQQIVLFSDHQIGRALQNNTVIAKDDVSRNHAIICWDEYGWKLVDRSKNGTVVNNRIICQQAVALPKGSKIQFGIDNDTIWELLDNNPPVSFLKSETRQDHFIELSSVLFLDESENSVVSFFFNSNGLWYIDNNKDIIALNHKDIVCYNSESWTFNYNEAISATTDIKNIASFAYCEFTISADSETIGFKIRLNEQLFDLGERIYNHILLKLAIQKDIDCRDGCSEERQGWISIDELSCFLSKELQNEIDEYYINVQIHRLRKKIQDVVPYCASFLGIIERKNRELRFGNYNYKIKKTERVKDYVITPLPTNAISTRPIALV